MNKKEVMQPFTQNLINELLSEKTKIHVKANMCGEDWGEISLTSLTTNSICPNTLLSEIKTRFQTLTFNGSTFIARPFRIDSHNNKSLHVHFFNDESEIEVSTVSDLFQMILGSSWTNHRQFII